jgi:hypothetical protein
MRAWVTVVAAAVAGFALAGCVPSPAELYQEREKFLDKVTADGITYRGQLQRQGSQVSEQACGLGYDLRGYKESEIPPDPQQDGPFSEKAHQVWLAQVRESYMKGCLTGSPRPKPEPSGVKAVTPVPLGSSAPSGTPSS